MLRELVAVFSPHQGEFIMIVRFGGTGVLVRKGRVNLDLLPSSSFPYGLTPYPTLSIQACTSNLASRRVRMSSTLRSSGTLSPASFHSTNSPKKIGLNASKKVHPWVHSSNGFATYEVATSALRGTPRRARMCNSSAAGGTPTGTTIESLVSPTAPRRRRLWNVQRSTSWTL